MGKVWVSSQDTVRAVAGLPDDSIACGRDDDLDRRRHQAGRWHSNTAKRIQPYMPQNNIDAMSA